MLLRNGINRRELIGERGESIVVPGCQDLQERDGRRIIPDRLLELPDV